MSFSLAGDLSSSSVFSFKIDIDFSADGDRIRIPISEVLLCDAAADLARSKNQRYCTPRNAVLFPPSPTKAAILHEELDAGELLKNIDRSITEWAKEGETTSGEDDDNDEDSEVSVETKDEKTTETGKAKLATAETLVIIADNYDNVLAFLQTVAVNSPRVIAAPLSLLRLTRLSWRSSY